MVAHRKNEPTQGITLPPIRRVIASDEALAGVQVLGILGVTSGPAREAVDIGPARAAATAALLARGVQATVVAPGEARPSLDWLILDVDLHREAEGAPVAVNVRVRVARPALVPVGPETLLCTLDVFELSELAVTDVAGAQHKMVESVAGLARCVADAIVAAQTPGASQHCTTPDPEGS